jgi:hypothetical protein
MGSEIVLGLHFYQPPREATHPKLNKISTDPENKNWTAIIEKECYEPLAREGILNKVSFDIYQSLYLQLEKINPETALLYKKSMKENGIGEAFIHPILPDLSLEDKSIVISAGVSRFQEITGVNPKIFWPPETAIDTETLEVLSDNGYEGFVCAPEQIIQNNGSKSDNQPTLISLPNGKQLIAYPFDRPISSNLAFKEKPNADIFTQTYIKPSSENTPPNQVIIAWTDAETFGHHFQNGDKFLSYLLDSSLPSIGLYPVSINNLRLDRSKLPTGIIEERSAWSCPHGNLIRWNGSCGCAWDQDSSWKKPFSEAMNFINQEVSDILKNEIGPDYGLLVASSFYEHYAHPETIIDTTKALLAAKISSLIAKTSCATFFSSPEVSGKINILYAYQSLLYLEDAGLGATSSMLKENLFQKLSNIQYPNTGENALNTLEKMLRR